MARLLVVLAGIAFGLTGCGGNKPTLDDASTVKAMLTSTNAVSRAVEPLYKCLPEDVRCYTKSGPTLVTVVNEEKRRFESVLGETDNECLAEVGRLYRSSLDAYGEAGRAAVDGNTRVFGQAIDRSTQLEIAYLHKLDECGFQQGRPAELSAAIREVNIDLLKLSDEAASCSDEACALTLARRMEKRAADGAALVDEFRGEIGNEIPVCYPLAMEVFGDAFRAVERAAAAIQEGDVGTAEREATKAGELEADANERMAICLSNAGA